MPYASPWQNRWKQWKSCHVAHFSISLLRFGAFDLCFDTDDWRVAIMRITNALHTPMPMIPNNQHNSLRIEGRNGRKKTELGWLHEKCCDFCAKIRLNREPITNWTNAEIFFSLQRKKSTNFIFYGAEDKLENCIYDLLCVIEM